MIGSAGNVIIQGLKAQVQERRHTDMEQGKSRGRGAGKSKGRWRNGWEMRMGLR